MDKVLIIGGGHQGLAMAAHLTLCGEEVSLWNRSPEHISKIRQEGMIRCAGVIKGEAHVSSVSTNLEKVMSNRIMITTPASAHRSLAITLAPFVTKDTVIILNPGRTFGAVEFAAVLREQGAPIPHISETQTIIYTCRRDNENSVEIFALKRNVMVASLKHDSLPITMSAIPDCIRSYYKPVNSILKTSLGNVGMVLHCAPMLMNIGWIESSSAEFKYYYDGISPSIATFLEKMDCERLAVAVALGEKVPSVVEWMCRTYNIEGSKLHECIMNNVFYKSIDAPKVIDHRYLNEDVPCGLVPIEYLAKHIGVPTPNISLVIDLAQAIMKCDYRRTGRQFTLDEIEWSAENN